MLTSTNNPDPPISRLSEHQVLYEQAKVEIRQAPSGSIMPRIMDKAIALATVIDADIGFGVLKSYLQKGDTVGKALLVGAAITGAVFSPLLGIAYAVQRFRKGDQNWEDVFQKKVYPTTLAFTINNISPNNISPTSQGQFLSPLDPDRISDPPGQPQSVHIIAEEALMGGAPSNGSSDSVTNAQTLDFESRAQQYARTIGVNYAALKEKRPEVNEYLSNQGLTPEVLVNVLRYVTDYTLAKGTTPVLDENQKQLIDLLISFFSSKDVQVELKLNSVLIVNRMLSINLISFEEARDFLFAIEKKTTQ